MHLLHKLVIIIFCSTTAIESASQKTTYYDLVVEKISLPSMFIDTSIKMQLDVRIFNNKGKELKVAIPVTLLQNDNSIRVDKKLVDIIRASEMFIELSLTNNIYNRYADSTHKIINFTKSGSFTLESQGSKELGGINSPELPKGLEYKFLWAPVIYWRLERSDLQ